MANRPPKHCDAAHEMVNGRYEGWPDTLVPEFDDIHYYTTDQFQPQPIKVTVTEKEVLDALAKSEGDLRMICNDPTKAVIAGVNKDAEIITNAAGGKQSNSPSRLDLMPALATIAVGRVLKYGAERYAPNNWRKIDTQDHLNHVLVHIYAYLAGDTSDDHLEHAACRAMMALEKHLGG